MTTSVFANQSTDLYTTYECEITMRGKLLGGIPKSPDIIEGWLRSRAGINQDEEVRQAMLRPLVELGAEVSPEMSYEQLEEASKALAAVKSTNGFKRNAEGLYIEDRQIKAAIKEAVNILYAGERWGKTKKGPRNFTAERVFVSPPEISLGRAEPDGIELMMVHAQTPRGPMSSLSYHEYVEQSVITFRIRQSPALQDAGGRGMNEKWEIDYAAEEARVETVNAMRNRIAQLTSERDEAVRERDAYKQLVNDIRLTGHRHGKDWWDAWLLAADSLTTNKAAQGRTGETMTNETGI